MAQPRFGQKLVSATEIRIDDRIFRATKVGGDLMMLVHGLTFERRDGQSFLVFSGSTYALDPSAVG